MHNAGGGLCPPPAAFWGMSLMRDFQQPSKKAEMKSVQSPLSIWPSGAPLPSVKAMSAGLQGVKQVRCRWSGFWMLLRTGEATRTRPPGHPDTARTVCGRSGFERESGRRGRDPVKSSPGSRRRWVPTGSRGDRLDGRGLGGWGGGWGLSVGGWVLWGSRS